MTINFKAPDIKELKPRILVLGIGGAGGNAINGMIEAGLQGVEFIAVNTDAQDLRLSHAQTKIQMGLNLTKGLGAGAKLDIGEAAADESLNEIVNEEEIKVRENAVVYSHGQQVRADNNLSPSYLSADSLLRSADYEPQFSLSHDTTNKKTTINFTNAPTATSKIRVERLGDKYLAFKKKLKE